MYFINLVFDSIGSENKKVKIKSNIDYNNLVIAYAEGTKQIGFDLIKSVACNKYDSVLMPEFLKKIRRHGYSNNILDEQVLIAQKNRGIVYDDESLYQVEILSDEYLDIFLFICKLGNKLFHYEIIEDKNANFYIGGKGFFYI